MDNADLILKYKKLLDEGIISQEEFELKRNELLNLPIVPQSDSSDDASVGTAENASDNQPNSAPAKTALIKCVKCGEEYSPKLNSCPHCNFTPEIFVCPQCGTLCRKFDKACFKCGEPLTPDELKPAAKEEIKTAVIDAVKAMKSAETLKDWEKSQYTLSLLEKYHGAKEQLETCNQKVAELREMEAKENEYQQLVAAVESSSSQASLSQTLSRLEAFADHEDAESVIADGFSKWQELAYNEAVNSKKYSQAKELFDKLGDYKDSQELNAKFALQEKKRKAKIKKISLISGAVVAVAIIILLIGNLYIVPKGHYDDGVAAYQAKDYSAAIESFTKANGFKDSNDQIVTCGYEGGQAALEDKQYKKAAALFKHAGDYKNAKKLRAYCRGRVAMSNGNYRKAYDFFTTAGDVKNSKKLAAKMSNTIDFIEAESYYKKGELQEAESLFKDLPRDFKHNGVSVGSRLDKLSKYSAYVDLLDSWHDTSGYLEVRQTHDSTGIWNNWSADDAGGEFSIDSCKILKSGKVKIEGSASFWVYTEYSSLGYVVEEGQVYKTVPFTKVVSHLPSGLSIGDYTKLTISGDTATVNYYKYSPDEDAYFTYFYKTDMTFKQ